MDNPAYSTPRGLLHAAGKTFYSGIRMYTKRKRANSGWKVAKRPRKGFPSVFRASRQRNGYGNVTAQHDSKGVYFRRRMPARKRRRWKRFSKKVNFVLNKSLGTCAFVRAVALSRSADFISTQVLGCAMSMSGYGSASDLSDDQIVLLKDAAQRTLGDAQYYYQQVIRVSSVVMDVTFESSAFYPTGSAPVVETLLIWRWMYTRYSVLEMSTFLMLVSLSVTYTILLLIVQMLNRLLLLTMRKLLPSVPLLQVLIWVGPHGNHQSFAVTLRS